MLVHLSTVFDMTPAEHHHHMRLRFVHAVALAGLVALTSACAPAQATPATQPRPASSTTTQVRTDTTKSPPGAGALSAPNADPFPSTYAIPASRATLIRNVTILTAAGPTIRNGSVLLRDGKIAAVGTTVAAPADAEVIDGQGKYLTPGDIDDHSHLGVYAAPGVDALSDGNEATNPVTAQVWAEHSVWPQDPQFPRALASGVTTALMLPGSAKLISSRTQR